jgi:hypothetical protein
VHIFQVIAAGWNNFRAMVTGFEVKKIVEKEEVIPVPEPDKPVTEKE